MECHRVVAVNLQCNAVAVHVQCQNLPFFEVFISLLTNINRKILKLNCWADIILLSIEKFLENIFFVMFQAQMLLCNISNNLISFRTCIINWPNSLEKLFPPQRTSLTLATILWMRETLSNIWIPSSYQELLAQRAVQKLEMWAEYYLSNIQCVQWK